MRQPEKIFFSKHFSIIKPEDSDIKLPPLEQILLVLELLPYFRCAKRQRDVVWNGSLAKMEGYNRMIFIS